MDPVARELTDVPIRRGNPPNVLDSAELSLTVPRLRTSTPRSRCSRVRHRDHLTVAVDAVEGILLVASHFFTDLRVAYTKPYVRYRADRGPFK